MGALKGFVIADEKEAKRLGDLADFAADESELVQKAIGFDEIGALQQVMFGTELLWHKWGDKHLLYNDEGSFVFRLPDGLIRALSELRSAEVAPLTKRWLRILLEEVWSGQSMKELELPTRNFLKDLKGLAAKAVEANKPILMWLSM
jgi:hypothetical protein